MKPVRALGLGLSLLLLLTLSCQTVTGLVNPKATATRPSPANTRAPQPTPKAAATRPSPADTQAPQPTPTAAAPSSANADAPTLGTADETKAAISADPQNILEALASEQYTSDDMAQMNRTFPYTIDLTADQPVLWEYGWCATTAAILQDNLKHLTPRFFMNKRPADISQFYAFDSESTDSQSNATLQCHSYAVLVTHWPQGQTQLETIVTFDATINDGMSDYPPGSQTMAYTVTRP